MLSTKFCRLIPILSIALMLLVGWSSQALALGKERWTGETPAGAFFNDYDPNFHTGFAPRVQDRRYVTIHVGRGNQLRLRIVLPDEAIESYLQEQATRHALFKEVIDKEIIELTANSAWEAYDAQTTYKGRKIPKFVTTGVWTLIPRQHGSGYTAMDTMWIVRSCCLNERGRRQRLDALGIVLTGSTRFVRESPSV